MDDIQYGTAVKADNLIQLVKHSIEVNRELCAANQVPTPLCIWGSHGIGKTRIVEQIAKELDFNFTYIAPAQFEEMGDLIGMPAIEGGMTTFRPPEWVPKKEEPGILLIDDVNRADDRILRGIMQLLQNHELVSWSLPKGWQIILTANPEGGDYSVTSMDDAMITRMIHVTLQFDAVQWAKWAGKNNVDDRIIDFVLTYPEAVTGNRTTPRTLEQFSRLIKKIGKLKSHLKLIKILGDACLDKNTVSAFISYINKNLHGLISPEEILTATDFSKTIEEFSTQVQQKQLRMDSISTVTTRLTLYLAEETTVLDERGLDNLKRFVQLPFIPGDLRLALLQDLTQIEKTRTIARDPQISRLLLSQI